MRNAIRRLWRRLFPERVPPSMAEIVETTLRYRAQAPHSNPMTRNSRLYETLPERKSTRQ